MTADVVAFPRLGEIKADPNLRTTVDLCKAFNLTNRQIDVWTRTGLIPGCERTFGSGNPRAFTIEQAEFLGRLARLVHAGFHPKTMAEALQDQTVNGVLPDVIRMGFDIEIHLLPQPESQVV